MAPSRPDQESPDSSPGPGQAISSRHGLREQDVLWADFLALAASVVTSLEKSIQAICDGRFDLISEVENEEEDSDRREVRIEQECLRIFGALRAGRLGLEANGHGAQGQPRLGAHRRSGSPCRARARKLSRTTGGLAMPEALQQLAHDVLSHVRASYEALASRDPAMARAVIAGDAAIDVQYRAAQTVQERSGPAARAA